jgi:tRNA(His) 5'-end guanylyltransferase
MQDTMKYLCENVQGCVFGYTQSDEITLILCDYKTLKTDAWFNYEVQKICSVSASMATMAFNKFFAKNVSYTLNFRESLNFKDVKRQEQEKKYKETLCNAIVQGAMFDARCFNIPKEEVTNLIYWRQLDAIRNSIQMVGQANFSHSQLQGKNCNDIQEMLWTEKHIHWDGYAIYNKRGSACYKTENGVWYVDLQMPILKGRDRWYVESLIDFS